MKIFSKLLSFLLVIQFSQISNAAILGKMANVKTGSYQKLQTKILTSNITVTSGQIYRINSSNVHLGDDVRVIFAGGAFNRSVKAVSYEGYIKFPIPFIVDINNPKLQIGNQTVSATVVNKGINFTKIKIRKPNLFSNDKKNVVKKYYNFLKDVANHAKLAADSHSQLDISAQMINFDSIVSTSLNELNSTGKISVTYDSVTRILDKNDLGVLGEMITGCIMGILMEDQPEKFIGDHDESDLDVFFANWQSYNFDSSALAFSA